jgi:pimeloyl-ACP methyl ester carboxylesterase
MGSFIALRLAARWPKLVRSLLLVGASAEAEQRRNGPRYALIIAIVGLFGPKPLSGPMMRILFGDTFLQAPERQADRMRWRSAIEALPRSIRLAAAASARRGDISDLLSDIAAPTLLLTGAEDRPTPLPLGEAVARRIVGARIEVIPATGHAVMLEQPALFHGRMHQFLREVEKSEQGA